MKDLLKGLRGGKRCSVCSFERKVNGCIHQVFRLKALSQQMKIMNALTDIHPHLGKEDCEGDGLMRVRS